MPLKIRKHHSLTTRYVIIVGLLLFAANIILGLVMLNQSKSMMKTMIIKNMLDISNTAADLLDGDVMEALTEDDVGTPVFQAISDMLFVFMNNADIEFIYAVRQVDKDTYVFTVDPDPVDPGEFGEEILVTNALVQAAKGIATVDDAPAADRWGNFYSAYSPIFNSKGEVAGVVGLDFSAQWYEEQIRQHTFSITIISMLSVLVGAAVMILITSKVRRKFEELDSGLSDLAKNLDALAEEISSDPGYKQSVADAPSPAKATEAVVEDEMEALGLKIRTMQHEMERYLDYVHAQAFTDPLTHVGNTNAYQEEIRRLDEQIKNGNADFCAVIFDIDNLKIVNDRFGHSCGDRIIRGAGMAIAGVFGRDRTFRIGGDEFIAIPLGLTEAQANAKLSSVDAAVKSFNTTPVHPDAALSLSYGVAACREGDKRFRDVFVRADEAMYKTKGEHHRRGAETVKNES